MVRKPIRSAALRNPALGDRLKQASRDTFRGIVDLAIAEGVDALVLAGDIFDNDHPDLKTRAFLITQLSRAAQAGVAFLEVASDNTTAVALYRTSGWQQVGLRRGYYQRPGGAARLEEHIINFEP